MKKVKTKKRSYKKNPKHIKVVTSSRSDKYNVVAVKNARHYFWTGSKFDDDRELAKGYGKNVAVEIAAALSTVHPKQAGNVKFGVLATDHDV